MSQSNSSTNIGEDNFSTPSSSQNSNHDSARMFVLPEEIENIIKNLDETLAQYPIFQKLCLWIPIRPAYLFSIAVFLAFDILSYGFGSTLILDILQYYYPAWNSYKAIETEDLISLKTNLIYWIVLSVLHFLDYGLHWFPFWGVIKTTSIIYLFLPYAGGPNVIYNNLIRKVLRRHQEKVDNLIGNFSFFFKQLVRAFSNFVLEKPEQPNEGQTENIPDHSNQQSNTLRLRRSHLGNFSTF